MSVPSFTVRAMTPADLPSCLSFTQQVNWPHRQHDWQLHYKLGQGYVISDADQQLAGCILWWDYGAAYGSIGLVVVDASYSTAADVLRAADAACYTAKQRGRNCVAVFDPLDALSAEV